MRQHGTWFGAVAGIVLVGFAGLILAQNPAPNPGVTRTVVTQGDLSVAGHEAVIVHVEIPPGVASGWHTHPGEEITYITDGGISLMIAGQAPRNVAAGQGFIVPAGAVHNAKNEGTVPAKLVVVYVVEKGKPLRTEARAPAM